MTFTDSEASRPLDAFDVLNESREAFLRGGPEEARHALATGKFAVEALSCTIEDASVDIKSRDYRRLTKALLALRESDDWITPKLAKFLIAYVRIAKKPDLPREETTRVIKNAGKDLTVFEWTASSSAPFNVSNAYAETVAVIERTLSDPERSQQLVEAFAERIERLKREHQVDHLAFIEKEAGPVGAITMMTSLVEATKLPACVYREKHWFSRAAIGATAPAAGSRIAIVYDLIVSGSALRRAADRIKQLTGADTIGTVVLCGYNERRGELVSEGGQTIHVQALDWKENGASSTPAEAGAGKSGADPVQALVPGYYTADSIPQPGPQAQSILDEVYARVQRKRLVGQGVRAGSSGLAEDAHLKSRTNSRADTRGSLRLVEGPSESKFRLDTKR